MQKERGRGDGRIIFVSSVAVFRGDNAAWEPQSWMQPTQKTRLGLLYNDSLLFYHAYLSLRLRVHTFVRPYLYGGTERRGTKVRDGLFFVVRRDIEREREREREREKKVKDERLDIAGRRYRESVILDWTGRLSSSMYILCDYPVKSWLETISVFIAIILSLKYCVYERSRLKRV